MTSIGDWIETLYQGDLGSVELLSCSGSLAGQGGPGCADEYHFVVPLRGCFLWHVGGEEIFADSSRVLMAGGGEAYAVSHPVGGDDSLVVTPSQDMLAELVGCATPSVDHPLLKQRWRALSYSSQLYAQELRSLCSQDAGPLVIEESFVKLVQLLLAGDERHVRRGPRAQRTLTLAKAYLHAALSRRTSLAEVAGAVGVSPCYLTRTFSAVEGLPLHQYALKLKLATALEALPLSDDMTRLALDLGFYSHSHFTATFRSRYGRPPSMVRSKARDEKSSPKRLRRLCSARGGLGSDTQPPIAA